MGKKSLLTVVALSLIAVPSAVRAQVDEGALNKAFEVLKKYDWGDDRSQLEPIDKAVAAAHKDAALRKKLEQRLAAVLGSDAPYAAKDFACRKLSLIGTAEAVPALAKLLTHRRLSHMARYALERIPGPEAVKAMRDALPKTSGLVKVGIINSLGVRRDCDAVPALIALLDDDDENVAAAAAAALGRIGTEDAAKALRAHLGKGPEKVQRAVADGALVAAERLLQEGKKLQAIALYKALAKGKMPRHIRVAATRGLLKAAAAKKK